MEFEYSKIGLLVSGNMTRMQNLSFRSDADDQDIQAVNEEFIYLPSMSTTLNIDSNKFVVFSATPTIHTAAHQYKLFNKHSNVHARPTFFCECVVNGFDNFSSLILLNGVLNSKMLVSSLVVRNC